MSEPLKRYYVSDETGKLTTAITRHGWHRAFVLAKDHEREIAALSTRLREAEAQRDTAHALRNQIAAENKRLFSELLAARRNAESAEARAQRMEADARRYRFLRDVPEEQSGWIIGRYPHMFNNEELNWNDAAAVDAAIDAALRPVEPSINTDTTYET